MLFYGIPSYRLPKDALAAEIDTIRSMGAEFRMRSVWGRDFTLKELLDKHDAVFIAIGASGSKNLRCEGDHWAESGIDFLEQVAKGQTPSLGDRVVVVGGGNTAMDAARSAIRLGTESVKVVYRRTKLEMPCLMEEVEAAEAEGVEIDYLVAPVHLERLDDLTLRLKCQKMKLGEADGSGRRRPIPQPGTEFSLNCTAVIAAIGQSVDLELARAQGLETNDWGIAVNPVTGETSMEGAFAGGDAVLGADLAVRAVAAGRIGAVSIHQLLTNQPITGPQEMMSIQMTVVDEAERATFFREIERNPRPSPELIEMKLRTTSFDEVERGLSAAEVSAESRRCLSCGCGKASGCVMRKYATEYGADSYRYSGERRRFSQDSSHPDVVYEPGKCIMCDACVKIATEAGEEVGLAAIGRGFQVAMGVPFGEPLSKGLRRAARRAVEACPTGALALRSGRSCDLAACDLCSLA
jgi:formate dehydrogenase major subunit